MHRYLVSFLAPGTPSAWIDAKRYEHDGEGWVTFRDTSGKIVEDIPREIIRSIRRIEQIGPLSSRITDEGFIPVLTVKDADGNVVATLGSWNRDA